MRNIASGNFISKRKFYVRDGNWELPSVNEENVSSMAAIGGELFVMNHMDLNKTAEELRELIIQLANKESEIGNDRY